MGKTYRRGKAFKPKSDKDFDNFKKSNKFKTWNEKPMKKFINNVEDSDSIKELVDNEL